MAEDEKPRLSNVKTVTDWVASFYGTDALDYKKVEKIRHARRTTQFASICYVLSHNTKTAHTDFFESNYTGSDTKIASVASFVLQLLQMKFENGSVSASDFASLEGGLFSGVKDRDKLISDYLGDGGILDMCQSCLPVFSDDSKTAKNIKEINDDMDAVRKDHSFLLSATGKKDSTCLSRDEIFAMLNKATECASKRWDDAKGGKGKTEVQLQKDLESAFYTRKDLARKTAKMGVLGGVGAVSLGAVVSGVFWPAVILLPVYGLGKNWLPGWFKSMGAMWGNHEKIMKDKRDIKRFDAMQKYTVGFAEKGKKYRVPLKYRWYLRGIDKSNFKKQAKQMAAAVDFEGSDGKVRKSENTLAAEAIGVGLGSVVSVDKADELVPVDAADVLKNKINGLVRDLDGSGRPRTDHSGKPVITVSFQEIKDIASTFKKWESKLPTDSQNELKKLFAERTAQICETLIFENPMDDLSYIKNEVLPKFAEGTEISDVLKGGSDMEVARIKNFVTFAGKELTGLDINSQHKTLKEYIYRKTDGKLAIDAASNAEFDTMLDSSYISSADAAIRLSGKMIKSLEFNVAGNLHSIVDGTDYDLLAIQARINSVSDEKVRKSLLKTIEEKKMKLNFVKFNSSLDPNIRKIANLILNLKIDPANNENFISPFAGVNVPATGVDSISYLIGKIGDDDTRRILGDALKVQMDRVYQTKMRDLSKSTFDSIKDRTLNGKLSNLSDIFSKIGEIKYDTVDSTSALYMDIGKLSPKDAANYVKSKLRKQVYDVFAAFAKDNKTKFKTDIVEISKYLKKVNSCAYLDDKQKMDLSAMVSEFISKAFENKFGDLTETFVSDYKTDDFSTYLKSYESGGFGELFNEDQSTEIQDLKKSVEYMKNMQDVFKSLKLNDQFDLNVDDAKYIAYNLLADRNVTGTKKLKYRDSSDSLRTFITTNIKNMNTSFGTNIDSTTIATSQPYQDLLVAFNAAMALDTSDIQGKYDKYTALLILKNKSVSLFRLCMKDFIQGHYTGSRSSWIDANSPLIDTIKQFWANGILKDIDDALANAEFNTLEKCAGNTAVSEISKYGTGSETEAMLTQRQL